MSEPNQEDPSLITSHAQYAKGIAETTIGQLTGSEAWKASGEQAKAAAIEQLKQVERRREEEHRGFGKTEEMAGRLVGCDGMKEEGHRTAEAAGDHRE